MEFELLAEAPLFALDVLGSDDVPSSPTLDSTLDWPIRQASGTGGLSDVLTSMLAFGSPDTEDLPTRTSSKRSFAESAGSPCDDLLNDALIPIYGLDGLNQSPKRARSSSFDEIFSSLDIPDSEDDCDSRGMLSMASKYVFPPSTPAGTPTNSPTKPAPAPVYKKGTYSRRTVESRDLPNMLKPLTALERRMLLDAGPGAVLVRTNKDCELP